MLAILIQALRIEHKITNILSFVLHECILRIYISLVSLKGWHFFRLNKNYVLVLTILWHDHRFRNALGPVIILNLRDITVDNKCLGLLNLYGHIVLCIGDYFLPGTRLILFIFFRRLRIFIKPARITVRKYHFYSDGIVRIINFFGFI